MSFVLRILVHPAVFLTLLLAGSRELLACSPAGHTFVAIASLYRLAESQNPEARKLAKILRKYRWVVYWGAEGPDVVQRGRGYHNSHWFPLYKVDYHHPETFDLKVAQPYYNGLLRHAYRCEYGVAPADAAKHNILLARPPRKNWHEVGLAYACGYTTHLIADYFCHYPAKVWWDKEPKLQKAVWDVCSSKSYGVIQEFYAVMLWERFSAEYGVPEDARADMRSKLGVHHVDNGVLPYCALAGSKSFYRDWPGKALGAIDPSKYDVCAAPMLRRAGPGAGGWVEHESKRVHAMVRHMGLSLDEAIQQSNELTGWRATYARVIDMIVRIWTEAAPGIGLEEPDRVNVVLAAEQEPSKAGKPVEVPGEKGTRLNLALHRDVAVCRYLTRDGKTGPVTQWGKKPSGARFEVGSVPVRGRNTIGLLTDGPWLFGAGSVRGTFRLRLPKTAGKLAFRALYGLHGKTSKSDGVTFRLVVTDADGQEHKLFEEHTAGDTLRPVEVDLSVFAGQEIELSLISDSGPADDYGWDMGAWAEPLVVVGS